MTIYKRFTASCLDCEQEITTNNLSRHFDSAQCKNGKTHKISTLTCPYCSKQSATMSGSGLHQKYCKSNPSKSIKDVIETTCSFCLNISVNPGLSAKHELTCKSNPDRITDKLKNQFTKAREKGEEWVVSKETRDRITVANTGKRKTQKSKDKTAQSMKDAVAKYPDSYRGRFNRGHVKQVTCSNGFDVLGSWEYIFVEYCLKNSIAIQQPTDGFSYIFHGEERTYFPDFFLPERDLYIEVKGYEQDRDRAKWNDLRNTHNKTLVVIKQEEITQIQNGVFNLL